MNTHTPAALVRGLGVVRTLLQGADRRCLWQAQLVRKHSVIWETAQKKFFYVLSSSPFFLRVLPLEHRDLPPSKDGKDSWQLLAPAVGSLGRRTIRHIQRRRSLRVRIIF